MVNDPFSSSNSNPFSSSNSRSFGGSSNKLDLKDPDVLRQIIQDAGLKLPKDLRKKKKVPILRRIAGKFNVGSAFVSGAVEGALDKKPETKALKFGLERAKKSWQGTDIKGFSDTFRALGANPQNRFQKILLGATGLGADIIFDPLTYLTAGLGMGLKTSAKTLTKAGRIERVFGIERGTELFQRASKEFGAKVGSRKGSGLAKLLFEQTTGKKGLSKLARKDFIKRGISESTLSRIESAGTKLVDNGGLKFAGRTIISGSKIARSPVGKVAKFIGSTPAVQGIKESFSKLFIPDFGKNKKLVEIFDIAKRKEAGVNAGIAKATRFLYKDTTQAERDILREAFQSKKGEVAVKGIKARRLAKATQKGERLLFDNPKLQTISDKLFEGDNSIMGKVAKQAGIPEKDRIKFYQKSVFDFSNKNVAGKVNKFSSANTDFLKKFKGKTEGLIKDPVFTTFASRTQTALAKIQSDTIRTVTKTFGRPLKAMSYDIAHSAGYERVSRKILGKSGKETLSVWMPKEIVKELNKFEAPSLNAIDKFAGATGFDFSTRLFKAYVTSMFPGFHFRNIVSNQFLNMVKIGVDVLNVKLQYLATRIAFGTFSDTEKIITKTGKEIKLGSLVKEIEKHSNLLDEGAFGVSEQLAKKKIALQKAGKIQKINPFNVEEFIPTKYGRKFGSSAERQAKLVSIVSSVKEGKSVKEAVKIAEDALFNYSKLTDFERTIMKRIIPFYTFARKNMEFQLRTLVSTPGIIASQFKGIKNLGEPINPEDTAGLPDYILNSIGIKAGAWANNKYGQSTFITGLGLPIEEFIQRLSGEKSIISNVVGNLLAQMNPVLKYPAESALGIDFFRGRPITEINNAQDLVPFLNALPKPVAKQMKELLQWSEIPNQNVYVNGEVVATRTKYTANPFALHFLRNLFTSRIQATVGFSADTQQSAVARIARNLTGIRGWSIDQEQQKFYNDLKSRQALEGFIIRMGLGKKFETMYGIK